MRSPDRDSLRRLLARDDRPAAERERLVALMLLLSGLPPPPDPVGLFPRFEELRERLLEAASGADGTALEERFLELYCHLHGHEAPYTPEERATMTETGGYWCHAGGLSPVLKAGPWVGPETVLGDLGAGNGLQGLLIQRLAPHRETVQVEISSRMVECGRALQSWLGIPRKRVRWVVGDVMEATTEGLDFLYLYRPVRPAGRGRAFYERIAAELGSRSAPVVIFSVADCLRDFLGDAFEILYGDGHLTCLRGPRESAR